MAFTHFDKQKPTSKQNKKQTIIETKEASAGIKVSTVKNKYENYNLFKITFNSLYVWAYL